ncbi:MAG: Uma2 family endonuclease [Candidatus Vecturithrix sp.]|jgi:Uma2 family endonuclease|nr:Uma2 family endonuclease [Candidatus Vecturithrix sp.]
MAFAQRQYAYISEEDYLQGEEYSDVRHEYIDGHVYAMAGASDKHNQITLNAGTFFNTHLPDECKVFVADMKVRVQLQRSVRFYYPDAVVSCAENDNATYYRTQPCLIVEVLSKATERQDRGEKFWNYQQIPSLQEYLLLKQDVKEAVLFRRLTGWQPEVYREGNIRLDSVGLDMPLDDLYRRVQL